MGFVIDISLNRHFLLIVLIKLQSVLIYLICLILENALFEFTQLNFKLSVLKRFKEAL